MTSRIRLRNAVSLAALSVGLIFSVVASPVWAQLPLVRIDHIHPLGGQAGTTVDVRITGGANLDELSQLSFSHPSITAVRKPGTAPADNLFVVTIPQDVPPGLYDVSGVGLYGQGNPRTFCVSGRPEVLEANPNNKPEEATAATLGSTLNGVIEGSTDVDFFRFKAAPGRVIVADCWSTRIDSQLVPSLELFDPTGRKVASVRGGRFSDTTLVHAPRLEGDYLLRVTDHIYRGGPDYGYRIELHTDPWILTVQPQALMAGTPTSVTLYGVNLPEGTDSPFKLGRQTLQQATVTVTAPNERTGYDTALAVIPRAAGLETWSCSPVPSPGLSTLVRFVVSPTPVALEVEPNNTREAAQPLAVPAEVSGQFATVGDIDLYTVPVKKGQVLWIEVFGDRLDMATDPSLRVEHIQADASGMEKISRLTNLDDTPTNLDPQTFATVTDDAVFQYVAPEDGICLIRVTDLYGQTRGSVSLGYLLRVRAPEPDYRLVAVPVPAGPGVVAPASLRRGDALSFKVFAIRSEGFAGEIQIPRTELPGGLVCEGAYLAPNQSSAPLVVRATADAPVGQTVISLKGTSTRPGSDPAQPVVLERPVFLATATRNTAKDGNADVPAIVRMARQFVISVLSEAAPLSIEQTPGRQVVAQGRQLLIPVKLNRGEGAGGDVAVTLEGRSKTANIDGADFSFAAGETEKVLRLYVKEDAGVETTPLVLTAKSKIQYRRNPARDERAKAEVADLTVRLEATRKAAADATAASAAATQAVEAAKAAGNTEPAALQMLEAALKAAQDQVTATAEQVKQLEQALQGSTAAAAKVAEETAPKELEITTVSSPLFITVTAAPVKVAATVPGELGKGKTLNVAVKVTRQNGYAGPVSVTLTAPALPAGVTASSIEIPADATEGVVVLTATAEAAEGDLVNAVVQATCGGSVVESPVSVKVVP